MPANFSFIIEGVLAGMERPGSSARLREDLEFLKDAGIGAIVSLTETPLERAFIEEFGFHYLHLPVADFTPPSIGQIDRFIEFFKEAEAGHAATVVHCGAGIGRTGTMLACALVARGLPPHEAIGKVRELRPFSLETEAQEVSVSEYAEFIAKRSEKK